jgi:hypothetical protein
VLRIGSIEQAKPNAGVDQILRQSWSA